MELKKVEADIQVSISSTILLSLPAPLTSLPLGALSNVKETEQVYRTHSPWGKYDLPQT